MSNTSAWRSAGLPRAAATIMVVFTFIVATRLPFRSHFVFSFDPANYALAVIDFNIAHHQPHPPGSPLFVMAGRVLNQYLDDVNLSLEIVTWFASAIAVLAVMSATRVARGSAPVAGLILATHPIFWAAGEIAEPYACDAMLFALALLCGVRSCSGRGRGGRLTALSFVIGLGTGFRPSAALLLTPVWLWVVLRRRSLSVVVLNTMVLVACMATWLVPMLHDTGGLDAYQAAHAKLRSLFTERSVLFGAPLTKHAWMVTRLALWLFALAVPTLILAAAARLQGVSRASGLLRRDQVLVMILVVAPPLLFYAVVHFMKPYYALSLAAPAALLAGLAAAQLNKPRMRVLLPLTIIAAQVLWFLTGYSLVGEKLYGRVTAGCVRAHDTRTAANIGLCRRVPAGEPFLFHGNAEQWPGCARILHFYLPDADFAYLSFTGDHLVGRKFFRDKPSVFIPTPERLTVTAPAIHVIDETEQSLRTLMPADVQLDAVLARYLQFSASESQ